MAQDTVQEQKAALRQRCVAIREGLPPAQVVHACRTILQRVLELEEYRRARLVHSYVSSKGNEVDTRRLIRLSLEAGKRLAVPVVRRGTRVLEHALIHGLDELLPGRWGLYGPAEGHEAWLTELDQIGLVVVPGVAFDAQGNRLGLGGGYYDRFLARLGAPKVGLSYECLRLARVPHEPHDAVMDVVVTERAVYRACPAHWALAPPAA
ncbi:MAG: 5-formyltetrahydrofolate cyclo-ligase [Candidatus Latescibacterota bacterium]